MPAAKNSGFTIIEILISIAILSTLAVLGIPNLRKFSENSVIDTTYSDFTRVLKQAQTGSVSAQSCANGIATNWAVLVNGTTYRTLVSCKNLSTLSLTSELRSNNKFPLTVSVTSPDCTPLTTAEVDFTGSNIAFLCNGAPLSTPSFTFVLKDAKTNLTKSIKISSGGAIYGL